MRNREFRRKSTINHQLEKGHLNFHCRNIKSGFDKEKLIMKRCIKGGFLVLGGVVGVVGMIIAAMQNPSVEWVTPPGRMIISILENGLLIPTVLFLVLITCGLYILLTESKIN